MAQKYKDANVANHICDAKLQDEELKETQTKYHPDADGNEAMESIGVLCMGHAAFNWRKYYACVVSFFMRCKHYDVFSACSTCACSDNYFLI